MFKSIKEFIFGKPAEAPVLEAAPYKVPEPAATTPIPLVVEAELPLVQLEQVSSPVPAEVAPKTAPAKKAPAKTAKTAVKAAPKKAGRRPKAK
jgi:hypothetical protein